MRILLSCLQAHKAHPISAYKFWESNFKNGIEEAGHEWVEVPEVDWAEALTYTEVTDRKRWRERTWSKVMEAVRRLQRNNAIDLFLGYLYPGMVEPAAIKEMQRMGIPCVNFFCDNVREFARVPVEYRPFDLHWVPEFEALPMYRAAGLKAVHAPMPAWIPPELRSGTASENSKVLFIGSVDPLRRLLLSRAIELGAPISIGGAGWQSGEQPRVQQTQRSGGISWRLKNQWDFLKTRGINEWCRKLDSLVRPPPFGEIPESHLIPTISNADYISLTRESSVTLGINRVPTFRRSWRTPLIYSRLRDIEAPMLGACYLTEWTAGVEELYDVGREIETYRTAEELVDKVNGLQSDPAKRARLRQAGQRRALTDHTVARSLQKVTECLGLNRDVKLR